MTIQRSYIPITVLIIAIAIVLHIFPLKKRFVLPTSIMTICYRWGSLLAIACLALIPLQIQREQKQYTNQTVPIQILFDVSLSMTADDILPSRFAVAQEMVDQLLIARDGYPLSIILFSGIPFVHVPFSTHTESIRAKWATTSLAQFPPVAQFVGTAIGDALLLGIDNMLRNDYADGVILLLTDGDSNKWYEPRDVLDILQRQQIPVFAVGIGDPAPFVIGYDRFGSQITTTYDPIFLQEIPDATGGKTWIVEDTDVIDTITSAIASHINQKTTDHTHIQYFALNTIAMWIVFVWIWLVTVWRLWILYDKK